MELYKYQKDCLNEIVTKFKKDSKVLLQLATSGGKTFLFSHLTKYWTEKYSCRVLVVCHREELVYQAIEQMNKIGITCEAVMPNLKKPKHSSVSYIGMIQTIRNRLLKNPFFFSNVKLIIADEAHLQYFHHIFDYFPDAKILGVTATPHVMKRVTFYKCRCCKLEYKDITECCNREVDEWSKPFSLSMQYDDIVIGPGIDELIDKYSSLVREISFVENYAKIDDLKEDKDGEFTKESLDKAYEGSAFNCLLNYERLCIGKKTMIFNSSTKNNLLVYEKFKEAGYNVRMYDSVNHEQSGCRKELVKWFEDNDDAILMNVAAFIAGFNSKEVQAIMLNTAFSSLNNFIQSVGRGARITDRFFKDSFVLVDGGQNIERHGEFSDPTRDWKRIFFEGIGKPKIKKQDAFDIETCPDCGCMYAKTEPGCPECGFEILPPDKKDKEITMSDQVLMPIRKIPPPSAKAIYDYTIKKGENINFAFKIFIGAYVDLFRYWRIPLSHYQSTLESGELEKDVRKHLRSVYFFMRSKPDIQTKQRHTIQTLVDKTMAKVAYFYNPN